MLFNEIKWRRSSVQRVEARRVVPLRYAKKRKEMPTKQGVTIYYTITATKIRECQHHAFYHYLQLQIWKRGKRVYQTCTNIYCIHQNKKHLIKAQKAKKKSQNSQMQITIRVTFAIIILEKKYPPLYQSLKITNVYFFVNVQ